MIILLAVLALVVCKRSPKVRGRFTMAMTIPVALIMGIGLRSGRVGVGWMTVFGLLGLVFAVWGGQFLHQFPMAESWFQHDQKWLAWAVNDLWIRSFRAAGLVAPEPRDYLSTFLKLGTVVALALAVIVIIRRCKCRRFRASLTALVLSLPARFFRSSASRSLAARFPLSLADRVGHHAQMIERESRIRDIGYGAMVTEMMVALMALIAACVLQPGQYFAINTKGTPNEVVAKVSAAGFPVSESEMARLATDLGENTMFGRAGGAPTFAVGMAHMFARVSARPAALALWYHFAIMFEALFILTTIDAGTVWGVFSCRTC